MPLDLLEGAGGCDASDAVSHEGVAGTVWVASEDVTVSKLPNEALTAGEDRAREAEVVQNLEIPSDGQKLHTHRGAPLVGAEADRGERRKSSRIKLISHRISGHMMSSPKVMIHAIFFKICLRTTS